LDKALNKKSERLEFEISDTGEVITIPRKALKLLTVVLSNMTEGRGSSLLSVDAELTTQQAADFLNVSRPRVVQLLDNEKIYYKMVGTHRRILLEDLLKYQASQKERREKK